MSPVRRKLQSSILIVLYDHCVQQIDVDRALPRYQNFDRSVFAASDVFTLPSIHPDGTVRFLELGKVLVSGHPLDFEGILGEDENSLAEACRRCAKTCLVTNTSLLFLLRRSGKLRTSARSLIQSTARDGRLFRRDLR